MHSFNQEESLHKAMATDFTLPFAYNIINLHITDITIKAFLLQPQEWCEVLQSAYVCLSLCSHSSKSTCPNFMNFLYVTRGHGSVLLWWQCNMLCTSGFVDDITFLHNRAHMMSAPPLHVASHWLTSMGLTITQWSLAAEANNALHTRGKSVILGCLVKK